MARETEGPDEDPCRHHPHGAPVTSGPSVSRTEQGAEPSPARLPLGGEPDGATLPATPATPATPRSRVLVVEDDPDLCSAVCRYLRSCGFAVASATDGKAALTKLLKDEDAYDVVVLDLLLPGLGGIELCRQLRGAGCSVPIVMATALGALGDRISGLRGGADDYLVKPFSLEELSLRVQALARRGRSQPETVLEAGDLRLDLHNGSARRGGTDIDLTRRELQLLELFMRRPGLVLSREAIVRAVWGPGASISANLLDQHIAHLRQKVDRPFGRADIETLHRLGYRLRVASER